MQNWIKKQKKLAGSKSATEEKTHRTLTKTKNLPIYRYHVNCARHSTTPSYCVQSDGELGSNARERRLK